MRKLWTSVAIFIICLIIFISFSFQKEKDLIVVVSGDSANSFAAIGNSVFFGAEYASEVLGSLPNDFTLKIKKYPDEGKDKSAEKVALQSVSQSNVIAVIGHSSSGNTKAALKVYTPFEMPIFLPVATNPSLTAEQGEVNNVYRLVPQDNLQASTIARFCKEKFLVKNSKQLKGLGKSGKTLDKSLRVAIIDDGEDYSTSLSKSLVEALSNEGISSTIIESGKNKQWSNSVRSFDPDIIIFAGYYETGGKLIGQLRANNLKQSIVLTDGCFPSKIFKEIKKESAKAYAEPGEIYVVFVAEDWNKKESARRLINEAKNRSNIDTGYAPFAADSFHIIHDAVNQIISKGQEKVDKKTLLEYLRKNRKYSDKSYIAGSYSFGESGDNELGRHHIYRIKSILQSQYNVIKWEMIE